MTGLTALGRPMLFDPIVRDDHRYPARGFRDWEYLNRSARPAAARARATYQEWFSRYPEDDAADFAKQFRRRKNRSVDARAFELTLHESFLQLGLSASIPQQAADGANHDFDLTDGLTSTAIEARVVEGVSSSAQLQSWWQRQQLDKLDSTPHARFAIHIWSMDRKRRKEAEIQAASREIAATLDNADPADAARWAASAASRAFDLLPRFSTHAGSIVWSPVPKPLPTNLPFSERYRGGLLWQLPTTKAMVATDVHSSVIDAIDAKVAKEYALDGRPLVIALACTHWAGADSFTMFKSLYGTQQHHFEVTKNHDLKFAGYSRKPDGVWSERPEPEEKEKNSSCEDTKQESEHPQRPNPSESAAAVVLVDKFKLWNPWDARWTVYFNPLWPGTMPAWLQRLPHWRARGGDAPEFVQRVALSDLLRPSI